MVRGIITAAVVAVVVISTGCSGDDGSSEARAAEPSASVSVGTCEDAYSQEEFSETLDVALEVFEQAETDLPDGMTSCVYAPPGRESDFQVALTLVSNDALNELGRSPDTALADDASDAVDEDTLDDTEDVVVAGFPGFAGQGQYWRQVEAQLPEHIVTLSVYASPFDQPNTPDLDQMIEILEDAAQRVAPEQAAN